MRIFLLMVLGATLVACETIKPYEKEYLLSPLMDDTGVASMTPSMMSSASGGFERLANGSSGSGGSSCPTCGG